MKTGEPVESLSLETKYSPVNEKIQHTIWKNRMRNLHLHIKTEYDGESKEIFHHLERIQLKMVDFQNHRRFTLRCLSEKVVPVSIKLESQVKTPKGLQIIRKTEISMLNQRIRSINNIINMLSLESDTCMRRLKEKLKEEDFQECKNFIEERRKARLCSKSNRENNYKRGGCSNNMHSSNYMYSSKNDLSNQVLGSNENQKQNNRQNRWVINISSKPLTSDQEKLVAHGPNYAIVLKDPPIIQYVAAVEHACTRLKEGKVEEFRVQVKAAIQKIKKPKPNLTKGERKAIGQLKKDQSRMILTRDKGGYWWC